jgi:hypothetical protein
MIQFLNRISPALRVHSWGGLGSQLFSAHLAIVLREKYPKRRIKVLVHTSGLTQRFTEFNFQNLGVQTRQLDDFFDLNMNTKEGQLPHLITNFRHHLKYLLKRIFFATQILNYGNTDEDICRIKPWTLALRGHYTKITIHRQSLIVLADALIDSTKHGIKPTPDIAIHYRLGDLLEIKRESVINPQRIVEILAEIPFDNLSISVLCDSPQETWKNFTRGVPVLTTLKSAFVSPISAMHTCIESQLFIGTSAKLALWIALFRAAIYEKESFLPSELNWLNFSTKLINWY